MKATTEEIVLGWSDVGYPNDFGAVQKVYGYAQAVHLAGYRTAEAKWMQAMREVVKELEEARDDVEHCLNMDTLKRPANKIAIEAGQEQLARIDALIAKYKEK
jgi:hypothetical protein